MSSRKTIRILKGLMISMSCLAFTFLPSLLLLLFHYCDKLYRQIASQVVMFRGSLASSLGDKNSTHHSEGVQSLFEARLEEWEKEMNAIHDEKYPIQKFDERASLKVIKNKKLKQAHLNARIKTKRKNIKIVNDYTSRGGQRPTPETVIKAPRADYTMPPSAIDIPDFVGSVTSGLVGLGVSPVDAKKITISTYCKNRHKNATDLLNDCLKAL